MGEGRGEARAARDGPIEARLDAMGRSMGGSPDGAAFAAMGAASGAALGAGEGAEFLRAVAARRAAVVGAWGLGGLGVIGVVVAIVVVVTGLRPARVEPAPVRRVEEPTFWNLRAGVQEPGSLDQIPGLESPGMGEAVGEEAGVSPARWPGDLRP